MQSEGGPEENVRTTERPQHEVSGFKLLSLDDLSAAQIETFAQARGISDTQAFLNAVERADAWSFTARPHDLEELVEFWIDRGEIGSRLDLMRNGIARRLTERSQDRAEAHPLPLKMAKRGAALLAATAILAQNPIIRVPDGVESAKGISVGDVLPDWDEQAQVTLLSRPIFDEAIYGTVRFHHRSVREYLTAEWLAGLLKKETSRRKIKSLLYRNQYRVGCHRSYDAASSALARPT